MHTLLNAVILLEVLHACMLGSLGDINCAVLLYIAIDESERNTRVCVYVVYHQRQDVDQMLM